MSATILIDCPKCGRKIGIPGNSGTIHVTCPFCREQWDWPRRKAPAKGETREAARALASSISAQVRGWWRATVAPRRFSGIQLAVALLAGIGIGVLLGTLQNSGARSPVAQDETASSPPVNVSGAPPATNSFTPMGINLKTDDDIPTNIQDLSSAKSKR